MRSWRLIGTGLALTVMCAGGCEQEEIRVYEAPADPPPVRATDPSQQPAEAHAGHHPAAAASPGAMQWTLPEGWRNLDEPRPMRIATLEAGDGEHALQAAISAFPGTTGGFLANINRWRDQFGLPPLREDQLEEHVRPFQSNADERVSGWTIRIEGQTPAARPGAPAPAGRGMLGAIIEGDPDRTWFVRADGDPEVLEEHEAQFETLVRSFRFVEDDAEAPDDASGGY